MSYLEYFCAWYDHVAQSVTSSLINIRITNKIMFSLRPLLFIPRDIILQHLFRKKMHGSSGKSQKLWRHRMVNQHAERRGSAIGRLTRDGFSMVRLGNSALWTRRRALLRPSWLKQPDERQRKHPGYPAHSGGHCGSSSRSFITLRGRSVTRWTGVGAEREERHRAAENRYTGSAALPHAHRATLTEDQGVYRCV